MAAFTSFHFVFCCFCKEICNNVHMHMYFTVLCEEKAMIESTLNGKLRTLRWWKTERDIVCTQYHYSCSSRFFSFFFYKISIVWDYTGLLVCVEYLILLFKYIYSKKSLSHNWYTTTHFKAHCNLIIRWKTWNYNSRVIHI